MPEKLSTSSPVVVLNTHYSGLGIARNLAPLGVRVIGVTAYAEFPGNRSKWVEYRPAPDSLESPDALAAFLKQLAGELGVRALLMPTRDHDINFLNAKRDVLSPDYQVIAPGPLIAERMLNKEHLFEAAQRVGIHVPASIRVTRQDEIELAKSLQFPCVCKPVYASQWRREGIWQAVGRQKAAKFETFEALRVFYAQFCALDPVVFVQEWIHGGEDHLLVYGSVADQEHRVVASFTARKRLQYPALMGTGIAVEAIPMERLHDPSRLLLRELEFSGISEIEYKLDDRTDRLYLIEVNPRHWDQHRLGTEVGVNLSEALYRSETGQQQRPMTQVSEPVTWIAEAEYFRHLARCLTGRASLREAVAALGSRQCWSVFDRHDIRPLARALAGWFSAR